MTSNRKARTPQPRRQRSSGIVKSREMAAVKSKNTQPELLTRRYLREMNVHYRIHVRTLPGSPDIYIARLKLAIFVNGCFWHGHHCSRAKLPSTRKDFWGKKISLNKARDERVKHELENRNIAVLDLWTCESSMFQNYCFEIAKLYAARSQK